MTAFTEERLARLREPRSAEFDVHADRGEVSVALAGPGDDAVTVRIAGGGVTVEPGAAGDARITLRGDEGAWEDWFAGTGGVECGQLFLMVLGGAVSDGDLPTRIEVEGDQAALFAHGRAITALLEAARDREEAAA